MLSSPLGVPAPPFSPPPLPNQPSSTFGRGGSSVEQFINELVAERSKLPLA